ncbi:replication protein A 70 kDa DNA-binding subunit B-like [Bidens hawaiensis]|uniref:replication protein A 70 kDa DNA-binding subunit B-like n=1 Tax=Bidens hawaiensis TaxID=980011 RepID=UPI0040495197
MTFLKPGQTIYYRACKSCNKKVTGDEGTGYSCQSCKKTPAECNLRYILSAKFTSATGGAWITAFGDDAEKIIGCSADELDHTRAHGDGSSYQTQLNKATWAPHLLRLMVATQQYKNEKKQKITAKAVTPVDYAGESKFLLDKISTMTS